MGPPGPQRGVQGFLEACEPGGLPRRATTQGALKKRLKNFQIWCMDLGPMRPIWGLEGKGNNALTRALLRARLKIFTNNY